MNSRPARGRGVAAVVAGLAVLGSGAVMTAPAQSAPPTEDCATAFPVAEITKGQQVDGLTVTEGTDPVPFSGEVLGVLNDGIAPGVDMIIADLADAQHPTRIDEVGIWQGMSGSPVYSDDGRLLGAVAYGLSWGPSTVAGITPYEKMDDYLPDDEVTSVEVGARMARTIAEETDVSARQAATGFRQLRVPLTISGISKARLRQGRQDRDYISRQGRVGSLVGTAGASAAADATSVTDGGNLGAAMSYGTITAGGVGTVTDRCGDDVVGFGHPMMFSGRTSLGLMPADALYVQEESLGAGFKVANLGAPAGTITQDRLTGITGAMGDTPSEVDISSTVAYGDDRIEEGLSHSLSQDWHADVTFMQVLAMHDVTIDAVQPGSETAGVTVTGTAADSSPFTLTFADSYVSDYDIAYAGLWDIADLVWLLSRMEGVQIDAVTTHADVTDSTATWRVGRVQQRRHGSWVTVSRRAPAVVSPGGTLSLRTLLTGAAGERWLDQSVHVPRSARREGSLEVAGGSWTWNESLYDASTVQEVEQALASDVRNDEVLASLTFWSRRHDARAESVSEPQDSVVTGQRRASVVVRR